MAQVIDMRDVFSRGKGAEVKESKDPGLEGASGSKLDRGQLGRPAGREVDAFRRITSALPLAAAAAEQRGVVYFLGLGGQKVA